MTVAMLGSLALAAVTAGQAGLIPRELLFGNPDRAAARLSPDGEWLSFLGPLDGVLNVWIAPTGDLAAARPLTRDTGRGISQYFWTYDGRHLLYMQDTAGEENFHVYRVDIRSGEVKDLTAIDGVRAMVVGTSHRHPGTVIVGLNDRNPQLHDLYRLDLASGERELLAENPGFVGWGLDDDLNLRFAVQPTPDGGMALLKPTDAGGWEPWQVVPQEDSMTTNLIGFNQAGDAAYLLESRGRNTAALMLMDIDTGETTQIAEDPRADVSGVMLHPTENTVQAWASTYARTEWRAIDPAVADDLAFLARHCDGEVEVTSRTLDDRTWIVADSQDDGPVRYFLYRRGDGAATRRVGSRGRRATAGGRGELTFLFTNRTALEQVALAPMHSPVIPTRDGLEMVSYLTLPLGSDADGDGVPDRPLPLVLWVHGGPWSRDEWGYNPIHQWLANRGYAVLSMNYRGSTGFGKEFLVASNLEWGGKMHDDVLDSVQWAIDQRIADPAKVAITGGSYGGYETLVGMTFSPEVFACGVDIVGPSNLITFIESIPPYWKPMLDLMHTRIGDSTTEEGRALLTERSPLTRADRIARPLLISQGANDPRVKKAESDQVVEAMRANGIPVTYVLYPDEGHGWERPQNRLSFFAVMEAFLAEHLGGAFEPIGEAFTDSSLQVLEGADQVPGLAAALGG